MSWVNGLFTAYLASPNASAATVISPLQLFDSFWATVEPANTRHASPLLQALPVLDRLRDQSNRPYTAFTWKVVRAGVDREKLLASAAKWAELRDSQKQKQKQDKKEGKDRKERRDRKKADKEEGAEAAEAVTAAAAAAAPAPAPAAGPTEAAMAAAMAAAVRAAAPLNVDINVKLW